MDIIITKNKNKSFFTGLYIALLFVIFATIVKNSTMITKEAVKQLIIFLFAVMACYIVMRFLAFEFVYQINDREIVIKQKSGKNEKTMYVIQRKNIICIEKTKGAFVMPFYAYNATLDFLHKENYIITYRLRNEIRRVIIKNCSETTKSLLR